jgi:hypothetical protein
VRSRTRKAFSAKRAASMNRSTPRSRHSSLTARTFSSDTGWPARLLLVRVITTARRRRRDRRSSRSSAARSTSPLKGISLATTSAPGGRQIDADRARHLGVGARRVEERVADHALPRLHDEVEQEVLGGAALVGGDDLLEAGDGAHRRPKAVEALGARVALVAAHHRRPLGRAHRAGARVGEQIDQDVARVEAEQVEARVVEGRRRVLRGWWRGWARRP